VAAVDDNPGSFAGVDRTSIVKKLKLAGLHLLLGAK
jgi:hypothetical protein